jgi:hypothetical protein
MADDSPPLVLVVEPGEGQASGTYTGVAEAGRRLLAAELRDRLSGLGLRVAPLIPESPPAETPFHWGAWFESGIRSVIGSADPPRAVGYAGAGAMALAGDGLLEALASARAGEVVANNRYSTDAFVVRATDGGVLSLDAALASLAACGTDNAAVRCLEAAGFGWRDLTAEPWSRFDVDTPLDLALLRLAATLPAARRLAAPVASFLDSARLPGGRALDIPGAGAIGEVVRDRDAELVVAGRIPASALAYLETETACRVRSFVEERGMRAAPGGQPRSLLADWARRLGPVDLVEELATLGDAVILDSRVIMGGLAGSPDAAAWPPPEERFASDFGDAGSIATGWLWELTEAASAAPVPFLLGGHALVSDGLRILVESAWLGH